MAITKKRAIKNNKSSKKVKTSKNSLFSGLFFVIDDHFLLNKQLIEKIITANGGNVLKIFTKNATHFISTRNNFSRKTPLVARALKSRVKVVTLDFLFLCNSKLSFKKAIKFHPIRKIKKIQSERLISNSKSVEIRLKNKSVVLSSVATQNQSKVSQTAILSNKKFETRKEAFKEFCKSKLELLSQGFESTKKSIRSRLPARARHHSLPRFNLPSNSNLSYPSSCHAVFSNPSQNTKKPFKPQVQKSKNDRKALNLGLIKQKAKYLSYEQFRNHLESKSEQLVNVEKDKVLFCSEKKGLFFNEKENFLKAVLKLEDIRYEVTQTGCVVVVDTINLQGYRLGLPEAFIEKDEKMARNKFDSLCAELEGKKAKKEKQFDELDKENKNEGDYQRLWWRDAMVSRKVLASSGVYVFSRTLFESFKDLEALDDAICFEQMEIALVNSGFLSDLILSYNRINFSKLSYYQMSQKNFLIKLLFEIGAEIGLVLGDFVRFYMVDKMSEEKPRLMALVYFEWVTNSSEAIESNGFLFEEDSNNIEFSFAEIKENGLNQIELLKRALDGDVQVVV